MKKAKPVIALDSEVAEFEAALLRSIDQVQRGAYAVVHTPKQIAARRAGRPVGTVKAQPKVATAIRLDSDVLERWRASGKGWQTRAAQLLAANAPK